MGAAQAKDEHSSDSASTLSSWNSSSEEDSDHELAGTARDGDKGAANDAASKEAGDGATGNAAAPSARGDDAGDGGAEQAHREAVGKAVAMAAMAFSDFGDKAKGRKAAQSETKPVMSAAARRKIEAAQRKAANLKKVSSMSRAAARAKLIADRKRPFKARPPPKGVAEAAEAHRAAEALTLKIAMETMKERDNAAKSSSSKAGAGFGRRDRAAVAAAAAAFRANLEKAKARQAEEACSDDGGSQGGGELEADHSAEAKFTYEAAIGGFKRHRPKPKRYARVSAESVTIAKDAMRQWPLDAIVRAHERARMLDKRRNPVADKAVAAAGSSLLTKSQSWLKRRKAKAAKGRQRKQPGRRVASRSGGDSDAGGKLRTVSECDSESVASADAKMDVESETGSARRLPSRSRARGGAGSGDRDDGDDSGSASSTAGAKPKKLTAAQAAKAAEDLLLQDIRVTKEEKEKDEAAQAAAAEAERQAILRSKPHFAAIMLSRADFMEVFTDLTVQVGGELLALPVEVFNVFNGGHRLRRVDAIEVFFMLALFSKSNEGDQDACLAFAFRLFDLDKSGDLEGEELMVLMRVMATAARHLGVMTQRPKEIELIRLTEDMLETADDDGGGSIDVKEFQEWARTHVVGQRVMASFDRIRREEKERAAAERREAAIAKKKAEFAERQAAKAASSAVGDATGVVTELQRLRNKKVQAQNESRVASQAMISTLARGSHFTTNDLAQLRKRFIEKLAEAERPAEEAKEGGESGTEGGDESAAGNRARKKSEAVVEVTRTALTRKEFNELMMAEYPSLESSGSDALKQLFLSFDADGDGTIDFQEFVLGLGKLAAGSVDDKLSLVFDVAGKGREAITTSDLMQIVRQETEGYKEATQYTQDVVGELAGNEGKISGKELKSRLESDAILAETFAKSVIPDLQHSRSDVDQIKKYTKRPFTIASLHAIWPKYAAAVAAGRNATLPLFRRFMQEEMGLPLEVMPAAERLFQAINTDGSGRMAWSTLFKGLASVTSGSFQEKASLYFALADVAGDGKLDSGEVLAHLMSSETAAEQSSEAIVELLQRCDIDGDGEVTLEEFKAAVGEDPEILEAFGRLMGVNEVVVEDTPEQKQAKKLAKKVDRIETYLSAPDQYDGRQPMDPKARAIAAARTADPGKHKIIRGLTERGTKREKGVHKFRRLSLHTMHDVVDTMQAHQKQTISAEDAAAVEGYRPEFFYRRMAASVVAREHARALTKRAIPSGESALRKQMGRLEAEVQHIVCEKGSSGSYVRVVGNRNPDGSTDVLIGNRARERRERSRARLVETAKLAAMSPIQRRRQAAKAKQRSPKRGDSGDTAHDEPESAASAATRQLQENAGSVQLTMSPDGAQIQASETLQEGASLLGHDAAQTMKNRKKSSDWLRRAGRGYLSDDSSDGDFVDLDAKAQEERRSWGLQEQVVAHSPSAAVESVRQRAREAIRKGDPKAGLKDVAVKPVTKQQPFDLGRIRKSRAAMHERRQKRAELAKVNSGYKVSPKPGMRRPTTVEHGGRRAVGDSVARALGTSRSTTAVGRRRSPAGANTQARPTTTATVSADADGDTGLIRTESSLQLQRSPIIAKPKRRGHRTLVGAEAALAAGQGTAASVLNRYERRDKLRLGQITTPALPAPRQLPRDASTRKQLLRNRSMQSARLKDAEALAEWKRESKLDKTARLRRAEEERQRRENMALEEKRRRRLRTIRGTLKDLGVEVSDDEAGAPHKRGGHTEAGTHSDNEDYGSVAYPFEM